VRERLDAILRADPDVMDLLRRVRALGLPQWRVVSGVIYQTVWNHLTGRPRGTGILDHDVIYFDPDPSWDAEDRVIRRVAAACPGPVQVRNQARVHLWYETRFGAPYDPLPDADESLRRYPSVVSAIGARLEADGRLDIAAPFGLQDLFGLIMRPGPLAADRAVYEAKAARAKAIWPDITVLPWTGA
jgi:hypothetical protein